MASRMTEDEKNEKIIRGLLKLAANRRCINCNNLGPQYVCTNFWTFICTNCSGIHREFCHRVKSISMAKFTSQEVSALQEGGNERAKEIFFKEWDPQRHSVPDSSNIDRLRDLIKHVYVERRYTGERNTDKPTRMKTPDDFNGSRRGDSYRGDSRSPPYDDRFRERLGTIGKNGERNVKSVYGERSPRDDQVNKRNPRHFEVVDNRQRDDRFGNGNQDRRFEDRRLPNVVTKLEGSSPSHHKDVSASSPPILRPVRDILGDDMPHFVSDPPKSNDIRAPNNPAQAQKQAQRTSSSSSIGSSDGNSARSKIANEASLIDFSADPEPSVAVVSQSPVPQTTSASPNAGDWAAFDVASQQNGHQPSANISTLESSITQLSAPALSSTVSMPISSVDSSPMFNNGGQWSTIQRSQSSLFPVSDSHTAVPQLNTLTGSSNNQTWGSQAPQNSQGSLTSPIVHLSQVAGRITQETSAVVSPQLPLVETKLSGRKELPADLFTTLYPSMPMSTSGWQRAPHPNMGYGMQYPLGTAMPIFPHSPKHANPFDLGSESAPSHIPSFPSMAPMQVALHNISGSSPLVRSSSFGNPSPQGIPQQQSSFPSAFSPGPYMMQQIPHNMAQHVTNNIMTVGNRGPGGPGGEGFRNIGVDQSPSSARYYSQTQPNTPSPSNSFGSVGGNPFG